MNIDLHTHAKLSKSVDFSLAYFQEMAQVALQRGLDAIAVTEHFNTKNFSDVFNTLDEHYPYNGHYYEMEGLKVFPGMEVDIAEVGHILCIGELEQIRALRQALDNYVTKGQFIPFAKLLQLTEHYPDMLVIGAHPFRKSTPLIDLDPALLGQLDAFDLNGKDLYSRGIDQNSSDLEVLSKQINKPVVAGSDTHHYMQYGVVFNAFHTPCETVAQLKQQIAELAFTIHIDDNLPHHVAEAVRLKAIAKEDMILTQSGK
ncbi:PHP domain-containing protein [Psychrobacillus sp. NPDC096623]|uniref:PHP domain-containing protein n=1 Tax=Psychrobacillus sp. NPDC096623 TaxID=3364492 RepID=UPI00382F61E3